MFSLVDALLELHDFILAGNLFHNFGSYIFVNFRPNELLQLII